MSPNRTRGLAAPSRSLKPRTVTAKFEFASIGTKTATKLDRPMDSVPVTASGT